ncbi:MAG: 7-carboxy-7-deazaguanine synthase QueE [Verrucomicrobia bacterium]|nr:7-carboxy-7-deazaguanine synthase QueE [Verrucomicrobiota bacterium]MDA1066378.1 7-carboxy-7-deazaguanine synthase QueE [Verrucomicrobiota bacterium]
MKKLPIYETFYTWQGEGCHMGKPAFFIRLFGCPVHCPWCDSAGTWHPDFVPDSIDKRSIDSLVEQAKFHNPELVVITGGEPCIHDLTGLTNALHEAGFPIHLETAGCFEIRGSFDWITVSPKVWKKPIHSCLVLANEFKVIVDTPDAVSDWEQELGTYFSGKPIWLHPEWSRREDGQTLEMINQAVKNRKFAYRAGYQLHKLYGVDEAATAKERQVGIKKRFGSKLPSYS